MSLFIFSSCAVLNDLDQAATLQDYSREQDALTAMVKKRDKKFAEFLDHIRSGGANLPDLKDRSALLRYLGEPVLITAIEERGVKKERWLYRYQKPTKDSPKAYFVVNQKGGVDYWFTTGPPRFEIPSITDVSENNSRP